MKKGELILKKLAKLSETIRSGLSLYPGFSIMLGLFSGIICSSDAQIRLIVPGFLLLIASFFLFLSSKDFCKFVFFLLFGIIIYKIHSSRDELMEFCVMPDCGAQIEAVIVDPLSSDDQTYWLPSPKPLMAKVLKARYCEKDDWREIHTKTAIFLPKKSEKLFYADKVFLEGAFLQPEPAMFRGDLDYRIYLAGRGVKKIFIASRILSIAKNNEFNLMSEIISMRNHAIRIICSGMKNEENKSLCAGILFGCKQGVERESRRQFLLNGMIHIFAVSGLHIGMISLLLFWIFRWMPFSMRHFLVPLILLVYVITTGFQPSAVRAFLMISIWCFQRAFFYSALPLNSIYLAASLILLFNPFSLFDRGFQFSFLAAGVLVLSWNFSKNICETANEKYRLLPSATFTKYNVFTSKYRWIVLSSLLTAIFAWLATTPISIYYQGLMTPIAIVANFAAVPFVWFVFVFGIARLLFFFITPLSFVLGICLEFCLSTISVISAFEPGFEIERYFPVPQFLMVIIFYVFLLMLLLSRDNRRFLGAVSGMIFILCLWAFSGKLLPLRVSVFHGGDSANPAFVVTSPGNEFVTVINTSSKNTGRRIANYLLSSGIDEINELILVGAGKEFCAGSENLFSVMKIKKLYIPDNWKKSNYGKKNISIAESNQSSISFIGVEQSSGFKFLRDSRLTYEALNQNDYNILMKIPSPSWNLEVSRHKNGKIFYALKAEGHKEINGFLKCRNTPEIKILIPKKERN